MKQIAIYGKGGIGKSTLTANLSAALAERGLRVLQIGCDPKHDSTKLLLGGTAQRTVLEILRGRSEADLRREDVVLPGYSGIDCIEAGGPEPGVGCAGRGILSMAKALDAVGLDREAYDLVVYDVLGDVVCGGFAVPMRQSYADEVYVVSSGEIMSLYAANNICRGLVRLGGKLGGILGNARNVPHEEPLLRRLAEVLGAPLLEFFPRDPLFHEAERARSTVLAFAPESELSSRFRALAKVIAGSREAVVPRPLVEEDFERLVFEVAGGAAPQERRAASAQEGEKEQAPLVRRGFERYLDRPPRVGSPSPEVAYRSRALEQREPLHSCALAGAFAVTNHILDALTVMHSPAGCAHTSLAGTYLAGEGAALRGTAPVQSHAVPRLLCTNLLELDSVYGGEPKLEALIEEAVRKHRPRAVFLITSCPSAIVGDDASRVARRLAALGVPIVPLDTDGIMKGDYTQGMVNAYRNLVDAIVLDGPAPDPGPGLVNLVGEETIGLGAEEDFEEVRVLLEALGLRVNTRFVRATTVESLRAFRQAPLSIRISNTAPALLAERILKERVGARFLEVTPPVGFRATLAFLGALAEAMEREVPGNLEERLQAEYHAVLEPLRAVLGGRRVLLGVYEGDLGWVFDLARDLGLEIVEVAAFASCMNRIESPADISPRPVRDADALLDLAEETKPDLLLAHYLPRGLPSGVHAATLPLLPPLGWRGTLGLARKWVRALRRGREGWRLDCGVGERVP